MGSNSLYSLSWGEFGHSLATAAQLLRGHGEFIDVTLAAGGRTFGAHKIVLSAASPFLLDLLKNTPCQHPVIMLADIEPEDLECLLEFVYRGEISVDPSQLPSLLQAAQCLSIHGLTQPNISGDSVEEVPKVSVPSINEALARDVVNSFLPVRQAKRHRKSSVFPSKWPRLSDSQNTENKPHDGQDLEPKMEYDPKQEDSGTQVDETGDGGIKARSISEQPAICPLCGAIIRQSRNLRRHLELLHFGIGKSGRQSVRFRHRSSTINDTDLHRASQILLNNRETSNEAADLSIATSPRTDHSQNKPTESLDLPPATPLPMVSSSRSVSSITNIALPGNVMVPSSLIGSSEPSCLPGSLQTSSCSTMIPPPPTSAIYSTDATASMLSCLLPSLSSLPTLTSPHDMFRHGEFFRTGVPYFDPPR